MDGVAVFHGRNVVFILEFLREERLIVVPDLRSDRNDALIGGGKKGGGVSDAKIGNVFDDRFADVLFENLDEMRVRVRAERNDIVYAERENVGRGNLLQKGQYTFGKLLFRAVFEINAEQINHDRREYRADVIVVRIERVQLAQALVELAESFDAEVNDDRLFVTAKRVVKRGRENGAEFLKLFVRYADVSAPDIRAVRNESVDVLRSEQNEIPRHKRIIRAVYDIRARTVDRGREFPVGMTMQNAVVVPQKSVDFVGLHFLYYFLYARVFHIRILPVIFDFVNFSRAKQAKNVIFSREYAR